MNNVGESGLIIGSRHDPLEREAGRCAEQVLKGELPVLSAARPRQVQRQCDACGEESEPKEILAKSDSSSNGGFRGNASTAIIQPGAAPGRQHPDLF
ncbi:MAG TPA: hypothetical protein VIV60_35010 [Polyangiaceae bacterium]